VRVVHVSPTYFSPESLVGGGERFAEELARAMSDRVSVKFVSFGRRAQRERLGDTYERVILRSWTRSLMTPFSPSLLRELRGADVIHCHQYYVLPTFLACLFAAATHTAAFVSDLGGGSWTPAYQIDQSRWIVAHLAISQYAVRSLHGSNKRHRVVYGGVDLERYRMRPRLTHDGSIVFLGRVLPHKGPHHLIEGLPAGTVLHVIGPATDGKYFDRLQALASGKQVLFHRGLDDGEVVGFLQRAMALVHPTPVDASGNAGVHELFGLALVEAMACGCPVIASRAASLPEIVEHGVNGMLVAPNSPEEIAAAVQRLARAPDLWKRVSSAARATVEARFTWKAVTERCLAAYSEGRQLASGTPRATATA